MTPTVRLANMFRESLDLFGAINKDPQNIKPITQTMRNRFEERSGMSPNRVILWKGGQDMLDNIFNQPNQYFLTGWRLDEQPNLLERVVGDLTYCETFPIKLGNFQSDVEPFQQEQCIGGFNQVDSELYMRDVCDGYVYSSRSLTINMYSQDTDMMWPFKWPDHIQAAGIWKDYDDSYQNDRMSTGLTEIGADVFHDMSSYLDAYKACGPKHFELVLQCLNRKGDALYQKLYPYKDDRVHVRKEGSLTETEESATPRNAAEEAYHSSLSLTSTAGKRRKPKRSTRRLVASKTKGRSRRDVSSTDDDDDEENVDYEEEEEEGDEIKPFEIEDDDGDDEDDDNGDDDNDDFGSLLDKWVRTSGAYSVKDKQCYETYDTQLYSALVNQFSGSLQASLMRSWLKSLNNASDNPGDANREDLDAGLIGLQTQGDLLIACNIVSAIEQLTEDSDVHFVEWESEISDGGVKALGALMDQGKAFYPILNNLDDKSPRWLTSGARSDHGQEYPALYIYSKTIPAKYATVTYMSSVFTLTSAYLTLFYFRDHANPILANLIESKGKLDVVNNPLPRRLARLQHSVHLSALYQILYEMTIAGDGVLSQLQTNRDSTGVTSLFERMDSVIHITNRDNLLEATSLSVSPMQSIHTALIQALNDLLILRYTSGNAFSPKKTYNAQLSLVITHILNVVPPDDMCPSYDDPISIPSLSLTEQTGTSARLNLGNPTFDALFEARTADLASISPAELQKVQDMLIPKMIAVNDEIKPKIADYQRTQQQQDPSTTDFGLVMGNYNDFLNARYTQLYFILRQAKVDESTIQQNLSILIKFFATLAGSGRRLILDKSGRVVDPFQLIVYILEHRFYTVTAGDQVRLQQWMKDIASDQDKLFDTTFALKDTKFLKEVINEMLQRDKIHAVQGARIQRNAPKWKGVLVVSSTSAKHAANDRKWGFLHDFEELGYWNFNKLKDETKPQKWGVHVINRDDAPDYVAYIKRCQRRASSIDAPEFLEFVDSMLAKPQDSGERQTLSAQEMVFIIVCYKALYEVVKGTRDISSYWEILQRDFAPSLATFQGKPSTVLPVFPHGNIGSGSNSGGDKRLSLLLQGAQEYFGAHGKTLASKLSDLPADEKKEESDEDTPPEVEIKTTSTVPLSTPTPQQTSQWEQLLAKLPISDCRPLHILIANDVPIFVGVDPWRLHQRNLMNNMAMVKDGAIGRSYYLPPDIELPRDGMQKVIFMNISMYTKAVVLNPRCMQRAFNVFCSGYFGGCGTSVWSNNNTQHQQAMRNHQPIRDILLVPKLMHEHSDLTMRDITGRLHPSLPVGNELQKEMAYRCSKAFCTLWGFAHNRECAPLQEREFENTSLEMFNAHTNTIGFADRQDSYNPNTKCWDRVQVNTGHWGAITGPGCKNGREGRGKIALRDIPTAA